MSSTLRGARVSLALLISAALAATGSVSAIAQPVPAALAAVAVPEVGAGTSTIWFDEPLNVNAGDLQREWEDRALPIGNGALGATVFGTVATEQIQFNEKTLWTGGPGAQGGYNYGINGNKEDEIAALQQQIWQTGAVTPAAAASALGAPKQNFGSYQTFGDLMLETGASGIPTDYRRVLDLDTATVTTSYVLGGVQYVREYFVSAADDALVVRLTADQAGAIDVTARVQLPSGRSNVVQTSSGGRMVSSGTLSNNGLRWETQVQVLNEGGTRSDISNGRVQVQDANSVVFVLAAATDYAGDFDADYRSGVNPNSIVTPRVTDAAALGYDALVENHLEDYTGLFDRVDLNLDASLPAIPTDELMDGYKARTLTAAEQRALEQLYFEYGRYLLISSSRAGSLPANLQGVWNRSNNPPWDADYHVNINLQMNYWMAESTNLSETTSPLFDYVDSMVPAGELAATEIFGNDGWVVGNETNPYGFNGLHNYAESFWMPDAAAWLALHYWEHYLYTQDEEFLRERAYPMFKSIAEFWFDELVARPGTETLLVSPSFSPEQGPFTAGTAMSQQIVTQLFQMTKEASTILGEEDAAFVTEVDDVLANLDPGLAVGSWGQIMEWKPEQALDNPNNTHRHVSQLFALFPANNISTTSSPELAAAAETSLNARGDGGTGWSKAWKINFWARLLDGDHSHKMLEELLRGSTLDNLWDDHPPFQLDGNYGATSGITEMLLQSQDGIVDVLPALPTAWPDGSYSGLKARGNVEVSATWESGSAQTIEVTPANSGELRLRSGSLAPGLFGLVDSDGAAVPFTIDGNGAVVFTAEAGETYTAAADVVLEISAPAEAATGDDIDVEVTVRAIGAAVQAATVDVQVPTLQASGIGDWSATPATFTVPNLAPGESHTEVVAVHVGPGETSRLSQITAVLDAGDTTLTKSTIVKVRPPSLCPPRSGTDPIVAWDLGDPTTNDSGAPYEVSGSGGSVVADGPSGSSQRLAGNAYVRTASDLEVGWLYESTWAIEFKTDPARTGYSRIFDIRPPGTDADAIGLVIDITASNTLRLITAGQNGGINIQVPTNTWNNLVVSYAETGVVTVYLNGELRATLSFSDSGINGCGNSRIRVGANNGGGERFTGWVDRVAVFPYALTPNQIADWQTVAGLESDEPPVCPSFEGTSPLFAWNLGGTPIADASGNNLVPTLSGPGGTTPGVGGDAQRFDGSTQVRMPSTVDWGTGDEFSVAAEVYIDPGQASYRRILQIRPTQESDALGLVVDLNPSNNLRVLGAGSGHTTSATMPVGSWFDLVVVFGAGGSVTVRVNDSVVFTSTVSGALNFCDPQTIIVGANLGGGERLVGAIDRIAVFPYSLTATQAADWQKDAFPAPLTVGATLSPANPNGQNGWYTSPVTVSLATQGGSSASDTIQYGVNTSVWTTYTSPATLSTNGSNVVTYRASEGGGAPTATQSVTVKIDTVIPTVTPTLSVDQADPAVRSFSLAAADATSGIALVEYRIDGGAWTAYSSAVSLSTSAQTVTARSTDAAGNVSTEATLTVPEVETGDGEVVVDRVFGADRFHTAIEISKKSYPGEAPVVYIANGQNYPDALSAGPAASFEGGPLLLVRPDEIPADVAAEIGRLNPERIVVVGGTPSVSETVFTALEEMAESTDRVFGADRFETSREIAEYAFGEAGATRAYVATGQKFPDALAAGGAAGVLDAPVILVNGEAPALDTATADLLEELGVTEVRVLGSDVTVSEGIFSGLDSIAETIRLAGDDRYETARAINLDAFASADHAFLATGDNFPDALAGSAWAGAEGAPLFASRPYCVPGGVLDDLEALGVTKVTLLGGIPSLDADVFALTRC